MMSKWDNRMFDLANYFAQWSKDPSTKVGAVITDSKHRIVSEGYNGPPRFVDDEELDRDRKLLRTLHAEKNAIVFAQRDLDDCTIYVTHHPCAQCAALIVQSGITRVVCPDPEPEFYERWKADIDEARLIFSEAAVEVQQAVPTEEPY